MAFIGLWLLSGGLWMNAHALRCYTDIEATQITRCKESEGFRTCFTKYNDSKSGIYEGQVTGRGCSTKDKVFYKECETHSYGEQVEKMCFCSYFLCNLSSVLAPPSCLFLMIIGATLCVLNSDGYFISHSLPSSDVARNPSKPIVNCQINKNRSHLNSANLQLQPNHTTETKMKNALIIESQFCDNKINISQQHAARTIKKYNSRNLIMTNSEQTMRV